MGFKNYAEDILRTLTSHPERIVGGYDKKALLDRLTDMFKPYANALEENDFPTFLGNGVEASAYELGPDLITKIGPNYEKNVNFRGQGAYGGSGTDELLGRLEPIDELRDLGKNYGVSIYPKAITVPRPAPQKGDFDSDRYDQEYISNAARLDELHNSRFSDIINARRTGRGASTFDMESGYSLPARSYRASDLHIGNVGYVPGTGMVAIDSNAGLRENPQTGNYPRQAYLEGGNLIERWLDEVEKPHVISAASAQYKSRPNSQILEKILQDKLAELDNQFDPYVTPYPVGGENRQLSFEGWGGDLKSLRPGVPNTLNRLPLHLAERFAGGVEDATPITYSPTFRKLAEIMGETGGL